jgi:imidazolonepropionase
MRCERIWKNARLFTAAPAGLVEGGVLAAAGGKIMYAGPAADAPVFEAAAVVDCENRWMTPGLIDCHTHLVFGGNRAAEFEQRLDGADYEAIARAGGGIMATVRATRAASDATLTASANLRLRALIAEGVTTVEIKSGYGLDVETELRLLRVINSLSDEVDIAATFLGAHALPAVFAGRRGDFLRLLCEDLIPQIAAGRLAEAVDGFCEGIAFTPDEIAAYFTAAKHHGLKIKLHADQLSNLQGAALAARFGAMSADHLEYTDEAGAAAMGQAGTVAVMLPGAFYTLRETQVPPIAAFRAHGVNMAVATDCNPGTAPLTSLLLAMNMAATQFRMSVAECLLGVTINAARALGRAACVGSLEAGKTCDLAIWDIERPAELVYRMGFNPLHRRVRGGFDA